MKRLVQLKKDLKRAKMDYRRLLLSANKVRKLSYQAAGRRDITLGDNLQIVINGIAQNEGINNTRPAALLNQDEIFEAEVSRDALMDKTRGEINKYLNNNPPQNEVEILKSILAAFDGFYGNVGDSGQSSGQE